MKKITLFLLVIPFSLFAQTPLTTFFDSWEPRNFTVPNQTIQSPQINSPASVVVSIDPLTELSNVLPSHFGTNMPSFLGGSKLNEADFMGHLKNLGPTFLRYPGGSGSDRFFWDGNVPSSILNNDQVGVNNLISGIYEKKLNHFLYFSSDAVYGFDQTLITEKTPISPSDYYSLMHITRELMIKNEIKCPFLLLRPTAVFGFGDTHNSYGPNRFINNAISEKKIILGGEGEETRDHIFVSDLVQLTVLCILYKSSGILNAASGFSISFMELAKLIKENLPNIEIKTTKRNNPITYRSFNIDCLNSNLNLPFSKLNDCIRQYIRKLVN